MKKSQKVILSAVMITAIAACRNRDEWISGYDEQGRARDTTMHNNHYRYYHGAWFPIFNNRISPSSYRGGSASDIASPGYHATRTRSGGFGHSSHSSFHSSGHS